jgi:hypothetical protein
MRTHYYFFFYSPFLSSSFSYSFFLFLSLRRIEDDDVFLKPAPKKAPLSAAQHATKTEMLMARRRASYLNSVKSEGGSDPISLILNFSC